METIIETLPEQTIAKVTPVKSEQAVSARRYGITWQADQFERARFGWMAILLTFQSCLGAVACLHVSHNDNGMFALASCAAATMGSNALFIALASPRVCLIGFYASVLVNLALIVAYF